MKHAPVSLLLSAAILASTHLYGGAAHAATGDAPSVSLPERDPGAMYFFSPPLYAQDEAALSSAGEKLFLDALTNEIDARYQDEEADLSRLSALISGDYMKDYTSTVSRAVQFSNSSFSAERHQPAPDQVLDAYHPQVQPGSAATTDLAGLALSPEGIRAMAMMTPDQIKAIAVMAELSKNPNAQISDLLAAAGVDQPQGPVLNVGDGQNLGLVGWFAGLDESGRFFIENDGYSGSSVEVHEGAVVGHLGRVVTTSINGDGVYIEFETGDIIRSKPTLRAQIGPGIPVLGDLTNVGDALDIGPVEAPAAAPVAIASGEISVSDPAPRPVVETNSETAGMTVSPRPQPRPESIGRTEIATDTSEDTAEEDVAEPERAPDLTTPKVALNTFTATQN